MAEQNLYVNCLISKPVYFADLCNAVIFDGKQIIRPEDLTTLPGHSGVMIADPEKGRRVLQRYRDVCMKTTDGLCVAVIACENQTEIHYAMPIRSMLYDALDYTEQVHRIQDRNRREKSSRSHGEFLSGLKKEDRLCPIVTLVLYYGREPWDGALDLHQLTGLDRGDPLFAAIAPFVPNYHVNLMHAGNLDCVEHLRTHLQLIFSMLKYNTDKQALYNFVRERQEELRSLDQTDLMALFSLIGEQKRLQKIMEQTEYGEGFNLCKAIDDLIADGVRQGNDEGEERLSSLISLLIKMQRIDLVEQVACNRELRRKLYKKYNL